MILTATLTHAEGEYAWTGAVELSDPASYRKLTVDDALAISLGGVVYSVMVDSKTMDRQGVSAPRMVAQVISPTARHASPRATPVSHTWAAPVYARDAAEEAVKEGIQWNLANWQIPGGRLAFHDASPIDVVRTIAKAAGGMVETLADGRLQVRHRFPVPVPRWLTTAPDHILTDASHILAVQERHVRRTRINRVTVRGYMPQPGFLSIEVDNRPDGLNQGRATFENGETAHLLVYAGVDVVSLKLTSSAGLLRPGPSYTLPLTQEVTFDRSPSATLDRPALTIDSVIWIGGDLGPLTMGPDRRTITAARTGLSIARVAYTTKAQSWTLTAPIQLSGLEEFTIHVAATGGNGASLDGDVICQRGNGNSPGEDIADPLLTDTQAKLSRGRAEIDDGEPLQEVSLTCVHRPGLTPGQLVEVRDTVMGGSWRGKITSVTHSAQGVRLTTSLELLRHVPTAP